jgi:hypothetical protein
MLMMSYCAQDAPSYIICRMRRCFGLSVRGWAARLLLVLMLPFGSLVPAGASTAFAQSSAYFGTNLIVNGNAEEGVGSADGSIVPVPGWTVTGNLTAVQYQPAGSSTDFPKTTSAGPPDRGTNFLAGGPRNNQSEARQVIDLTPVADTIDRGGVAYRLLGYFGSSGNASAMLWALFYNANGDYISSEIIGGNMTGNADLVADINEYWEDVVPIGTRNIRIWLVMTDNGNSTTDTYNNAYADSLSLILTPPPTADVGVSLSDFPDPVRKTNPFTHTITVQNYGPDPSSSTTVEVVYPDGAKLVSSTVSSCGEATHPDLPTHYFYCMGSLAPGEVVSFDLVFSTRRPRTYTTLATVHDAYDRDAPNNSGSTTTTVTAGNK